MDDRRRERGLRWVAAFMAAFAFLSLFGWLAIGQVRDPGSLGEPGRIAARIAVLPSRIARAWEEGRDLLTGAEATRYLSVPRPAVDTDGFRPVTGPDGTPLSGLVVRGDPDAADRGWRLLGGAMRLGDHYGSVAVLLDPDLNVARTWRLDEAAIDYEGKAQDSRRILHGLTILPDASIVFGFDHGSGLQRHDACNRPLWATTGAYHHSVTRGPHGRTLWAMRSGGFDDTARPEDTLIDTGPVRLDVETGEVLDEISVTALMSANPHLGLFKIAHLERNMVESNPAGRHGEWIIDPVHFNDVEALTPARAAAFPGFEVGDLLLSTRALNTVLVVDPDTRRVKWRHTGDMVRQHDPDWRADGMISVLDNAMGSGTSRIIAIDPASGDVSVAFDGAANDFYTRIRGKHMRTARGDLAVVSPQQGRAFEIGADGAPVLEFLNFKPGEPDKNLVLTEYTWLPEDMFETGDLTCPSS